MAWKVGIQKKDGSWSRNSKDITTSETTYRLYTARDNALYNHNPSTKLPLKKIGENVSKKPNNSPSVVARLMGVDMLPFDSKHSPLSDDVILNTYHKKKADYLWYSKPDKREHPQEEELQKFKKEFESWQSPKFLKQHQKEMLTKKKMHSGLSKIIMLNPGSDRIDIDEDSLNNTPVSSMETRNIDDYLEQVSERLKCEYQEGKHFTRCKTIRGGGIETPNREKPSDSIKTSHRIGQEMRNAVSSDFYINLLNETRCIPKGETWNENSPYGLTEKLDRQSWSFRKELDECVVYNEDLSPSHLTRSFSAPASAKSFGKLLIEHQSLVSGEDIRLKPEVSEKIHVKIKKQVMDKFSIKEKVSNLGYNLTFKGKLFGKRVKSMEGSMRDHSTCCTSAMLNYIEANENSTEVPPSPASVCSSVHEEFWRLTENLTPIFSSNGNNPEDNNLPHILREINSNLNELRRKLNQLEERVMEDRIMEPEKIYIHDEDKAFVRELLTAAGFGSKKSSRSLLKWDQPISSIIFDEAEETYKRKAMDYGRSYRHESDKLNHKIIFDLVNEVLPMILKEPEVKFSRYMKHTLGTLATTPVNGTKLVSQVWGMIRESVTPTTDRSSYSVDNMVARDFSSIRWSGCLDDDIIGIVRDTERHIMRNMIEEMAKDLS